MTAASRHHNATITPEALPNGPEPIRFRPFIEAAAVITAGIGLVTLLGWMFDQPGVLCFGACQIPMAPSTAVLFTLHGLLLSLRVRLPVRRFSRAGMSMHIVGALLALALAAVSFQGMHLEAEHLGLNISHTPDAPPVGHMSPLTAACFLLASLSYLVSLPPTPGRPLRAVAAACLFATLLLLTSYILALAYLFGMPLLYGSHHIPPALSTSLAFLTLGAALLALALPKFSQKSDPPENIPCGLIVIYTFLAAGIITAGYFSFQEYEQHYRLEKEDQLSAIADLKVAELEKWRDERLGDAQAIYQNSLFAGLMTRFYTNPEDSEAKNQLREWLGQYPEHDEYDQVRLLDLDGRTRMSLPADRPPASAAVLRKAAETVQSGRITFVDFYRHDHDKRIYLSILIPILDRGAGNRVMGIIALRIDPEKYLFPFILHWPIPSQTAETLLIRQEGNEVLYLNELKFLKDAALKHRISLERTDIPGVMAVLGRTGIVEGMDYRGNVPVIAALRAVPDSPWFLITRMNTSEVYAPTKKHLWIMAGFITALLFGAGAGLAVVWRQQNIAFYREQHKAVQQLLAAEAYNRNLIEASLDPMLTISADGTIMDVNRATEDATGLPREKLIGSDFCNYFTEPEKVRAIYEQVFAQGFVANFPLAIRHASGKVIDVLYNAALYRNNKGEVAGIVAAARDITERKRAEEELEKIFMLSSDLICIADISGYLRKINPSWEKTLGYTSEELLGTPFILFVHPDDRKSTLAVIHEKLSQGITAVDFENRYRCKDGSYKWLSWTSNPVPEKGITYAVARDISERKRAEGVLRFQSEILRNATEGISLVRFEDGIILYANPRFEQMFGYEPGALTGKNIATVHDPEGRTSEETRQTILASLEETGGWHGEVENRRRDGSRFWSYANVSVFDHSEYGRTIISVHTDITERKAAQDELLKILREQQIILDHANIGISLIVDRKQLWVNRKMEELFQYPKEDLVDQTTRKLYASKDDYEQLGREAYPLLSQGETYETEQQLLRRDGTPIWVRYNGQAIDPPDMTKGTLWLMEDITDRRRTEEELRESSEKFRTVADFTLGWEYWQGPQQEIIYMSPSCETITGYARDEFIADPELLAGIIHPDDRQQAETHRHDISNREDGTLYFRVVRRDGEIRWIEHICHPVWGNDGAFKGRRISNRDITERKQAEEALQKAHAELEQRVQERTLELRKTHAQLLHAEKLSAIGSLSASIAHEFNNPLQGVLNIVKGVRRRASLAEEDANLLGLAVTECHRMRDLIKNLQDFNRPSSDRKQPVDLHAAINSMVLLGKKEYQTKNIAIALDYAENIPQIRAVPDQIKQVILNLLNNAADACENGGTITIRTQTAGENIVFQVEDTGKGIASEHMAHIFEPFFSTKPAVKGTGLGLSVSYGIVKAHGGEIAVKSEVGRGTIFSVILPLAGGQTDEEQNPAG